MSWDVILPILVLGAMVLLPASARIQAGTSRRRRRDPHSVGPYRLVQRLGSGGMGDVYLGRDDAHRRVAVKIVHDEYVRDPGFRERLARETRTARYIRATRVAAVVDADPTDLRPWIASELVPGPSLEYVVSTEGPLAPSSAMALTAMLAESLAELHGLDATHRDVKPSNVLVADNGPYLIDFGMARAADITSKIRSGTVLGTPGYMSPEQALGAECGPASDVFSLAAVVVFALTGRGPFGAAANPVAMIRRTVDEYPDLKGVPDDLRPLLEDCLAKDPAARPTAADVAGRLAPHVSPTAWPPRAS